MELLQLKYFKDAFTTKNFSHTAEKYSVPQSAVSQSIKRLEDELGVQLFVRSANKITPNECGRYFYNYISAALTQIEKGINVVKRCDSDMKGEVRIKIQSGQSFFSDCIADFKKLYPGVDFTVYNQNPSYEESSFDFVVSADEIKDISYEKMMIYKENILLAVSKNSELAAYDKIRSEYVKNAAFISMQKGHSLYYLLENIFKSMNARPSVTIFADDPHNVRKYVKQGLGVTLFPEKSWAKYTDDRIAVRPFENISPERTIWLYCKKSENLSNAVAGFRDFVTMKTQSLE